MNGKPIADLPVFFGLVEWAWRSDPDHCCSATQTIQVVSDKYLNEGKIM